MADYNRNRQDAYRQQYGWNDDYGRQQRNEEEPNYTNSENRGFRSSGRQTGMSSGEGGWQSRYERQMDTNREGDYDDYQQAYGRRQQYGYGSGSQGLSSGYSDFGGEYSRNRNLYDRGSQGSTRRDYQNRENRIGGANYDEYGDRGRYDEDQYSGHGGYSSGNYGRRDTGRQDYGRSEYGRSSQYGRSGRGSSDSDYGRGSYGNRGYGHGDSDDRSWWDRTSDEVSSWFGDEDAERRRERDRAMRGSYRGKGPKNYSRSDDRIKEDINDKLSDDPFIDASEIDVTVNNGEVSLTGSVDHRSTKRRAEDLAEAVSGVKNVENRLRVSQQMGSEASGYSGMSNPSQSSGSQSTSPIPGSERGRTRETSQSTVTSNK